MHMESDVRIKEQRNIPPLQLGENIESLTNTGYRKCRINIHMYLKVQSQSSRMHEGLIQYQMFIKI